MLALTVQPLSDPEKSLALQLRAKQRGLSLSQDVANYLLTHAPRDMGQLFMLLERLDLASLQRQRKITIPFVKEVLWHQ
jgi:DnaA family protein